MVLVNVKVLRVAVPADNESTLVRLCPSAFQPPAPPGGMGHGAPVAPRRRPRCNVPKCKDGVGEMALAPLAVMVAREYSLLCMNYGNA